MQFGNTKVSENNKFKQFKSSSCHTSVDHCEYLFYTTLDYHLRSDQIIQLSSVVTNGEIRVMIKVKRANTVIRYY